MTREFAFFIITCDRNTQVLSLLLESIHDMCPEKIPIFVSTDGEMPHIIEKQATVIVTPGVSFGERMRRSLEQISYDQVIVMCDDFIVEAPIHLEELDALSQELSHNAKIAAVALAQVTGKSVESYLLSHYVRRAEFGTFKTTLQCGLWRRKVLYQLMQGISSPWEFELFANHRTYHSGYQYYALVSDDVMPIRYHRGKLIVRGHVVRTEKQRMEALLGRPIDLSDFPETDSDGQDRHINLWQRANRRLRLVVSDLYYRYWKGLCQIEKHQ